LLYSNHQCSTTPEEKRRGGKVLGEEGGKEKTEDIEALFFIIFIGKESERGGKEGGGEGGEKGGNIAGFFIQYKPFPH